MDLDTGWVVSICLGCVLVFLIVVGIVLYFVYIRKKQPLFIKTDSFDMFGRTNINKETIEDKKLELGYDHEKWNSLIANIEKEKN